MKHVLNVGYDQLLLQKRIEVMAQAGYDVLSASDYSGALHMLERCDIDALVLGHRVPEADRNRLARSLKQRNPRGKVIMLYNGSIGRTELADAVISIEDPHQVVEAVQTLQGDTKDYSGVT